jgi:hypothetical protein
VVKSWHDNSCKQRNEPGPYLLSSKCNPISPTFSTRLLSESWNRDHICRRLDQEDFQKSTQQTELAPKAALNLKPPPSSHEPKQHLVNVVMPNMSYEKEKESDFLDDPTPVQPYLQPRDQRPWLSICQTDMTQMSKFGLLADNPHG